MLEPQKSRPVLIVDPDQKFLEALKADPSATSNPPLLAHNGKAAQLLLSNPAVLLAGVFVNPQVADPNGFSVIRCSHQYRPATPLYVIYDGANCPLATEDLDKLAVQKALPKPLSYSQLAQLVTPVAFFFDAKATLDLSQKFQDKVDAEISAEDSAFLPIRAEDFLAGSRCFFDLYVRLNSGRYVKILQAGDSFSVDRITNYLKKGVTSFYLRKEAQERYLSYCDKLATAVVQNKAVPVEIKIAQTLNHGQETMNFFQHVGLSATNVQYAVNFLGNVERLTQQLGEQHSDELKGFLADIAAYEHGVGTAMISSLLITPLKIMASQPVKVIGLASMLHDIGLGKMDPIFKDEDETKMTPEQIKMYQTHPQVGAEILKGIRGVDPVVVQAVAQHHERRNKKGFPSRLGAGSINRVAEIIGISDELTKLIHRAKNDPAINPLRDMELVVSEGFSNPIVEAFRTVFHREDPLPRRGPNN